jgi:hypothetical protein
MLALRARGGELERDFAYGVVRQLLEPALRDAGPDGTAELLSGAAALARPLLSTHAPSEAAPIARDHAYAVLHALYWLCANLSARTPMLLAIDDAHWADGRPCGSPRIWPGAWTSSRASCSWRPGPWTPPTARWRACSSRPPGPSSSSRPPSATRASDS